MKDWREEKKEQKDKSEVDQCSFRPEIHNFNQKVFQKPPASYANYYSQKKIFSQR